MRELDIKMNLINEDRVTDTHVYFWDGIYSQWHGCKFEEDGFTYSSAEQYMMMKKALVFEQPQLYAKMKVSNNPRYIKQLGREIPNFSDEVWDKHKMEVTTQGNYLKFTQNEHLLKQMLEQKDLTLVEASPVDRIWGIGLHFDNDDVLDESKWRGQNLLGVCIMDARDRIISEMGDDEDSSLGYL